MGSKAFTVRLPADQAAQLERVAEVDGTSVAAEIRGAVAALIEDRRRDPEFQDRLRELIAENKKILEKLAQ